MEYLSLLIRICLFVSLFLPMFIVLSNNRANAIIKNREFQISYPDKLRIHYSVIIVFVFSIFLFISFLIENLAGQVVIIGMSAAALVFLIYVWSERGKHEIRETHFKGLTSIDLLAVITEEPLESPSDLNKTLKSVQIGTDIDEDLVHKFKSLNLIQGSRLALDRFIKGEFRSYDVNRLVFKDIEEIAYSYDVKIFAFICAIHNIEIKKMCERKEYRIREITDDLSLIRREYFIGDDGKKFGILLCNWLTRKDNKGIANFQKIEDCILGFSSIS